MNHDHDLKHYRRDRLGDFRFIAEEAAWWGLCLLFCALFVYSVPDMLAWFERVAECRQ